MITNPRLYWTLTATLLLAAIGVAALALFGVFDSVPDAIAATGSLLAASVGFAGITAAMARHADTQERLRVEAAISAADHLSKPKNTKGSEAALLLLGAIGYPKMALTLLGSVRGEVSGAVAAEVISLALESPSFEMQRWAASELVDWTEVLIRDDAMDWPSAVYYSWPTNLDAAARRACLHAMADGVINTVGRNSGVAHVFVLLLHRVATTDPDASIAKEAALLIEPLLPWYKDGGLLVQGELLNYPQLAATVDSALQSLALVTDQTVGDVVRLKTAMKGHKRP